jgi:hypothetical protein
LENAIVSYFGCDKEVWIVNEASQITGLYRPVGNVKLAGGEGCEYTAEIVVNSVEKIVCARSVSRPVVAARAQSSMDTYDIHREGSQNRKTKKRKNGKYPRSQYTSKAT